MLPGVMGLEPEYKNLLRTALVQLMDEFFDDVCNMKRPNSDFQATHMWIFLPPHQYDLYDHAFAKRFLTCLTTVGHKLESSSFEMLSSVAEQLAMSAIIDQAETLADLLGLHVDLSSFADEVLQRADLDSIFEMSGDHLDWFRPFEKDDPAHPYVTWQ